MTRRRDLLKGGILLSLAGLSTVPGTIWAAEPRLRFLIDRRLPEARHLRRQADLGTYPHADPQGEIIALLNGNPDWIGPGSLVIGLTGYVDYALARDVFRTAGRRMRQVWQLGPSSSCDLAPAADTSPGFLATLLGTPSMPARPGPTSFLWVA